jgi:hypothetical protein
MTSLAAKIWRGIAAGLLPFLVYSAPYAQQRAKQDEAPIPVHYTDIRKSAGITFQQDSTQTDQKYYLETGNRRGMD